MKFKVLIAKPVPLFVDLVSTIMIDLPVKAEALQELKRLLEADECGNREYELLGYQSPFLPLESIIRSSDSIDTLNELSQKFMPLEDNYTKRDIYAALLENFRPQNTEEALILLDRVDDFELLDEDIDDYYLCGRYLVDSGAIQVSNEESCDYPAIAEELEYNDELIFTSYGFICKKSVFERR